MSGLKLVRIPEKEYSDYRYEAIFRGYKWDPQVGDHNTVAEHVLVLDYATARHLEAWAEQLAAETVQLEEAMLCRPELVEELGFPRVVNRAIRHMGHYTSQQNVRLMRFDFHPTISGWAVSEVNSDVPGGLAEASVLPEIAGSYFPQYEPGENVAHHLLEGFQKCTAPGSRIAFIHATSYSDDRQVMQFLGDYFEKQGYRSLYAAPDHIIWKNHRAVSRMEGEEGPVDGIVRFFPLEWLANLPRRSGWGGYYESETPSCNHPVAIFAQSKRLPLIWDKLGVNLTAWKALLPETCAPGRKPQSDEWIYKPVLGRVGEGISIREAVAAKEYKRIQRIVRMNPRGWIAQKRFESLPVSGVDGEAFHLCVGVFVVDGRAAGFYGRISPYPRIDARAKDIPVLVEKEELQNG